jgi:excinuclease ABC subunit B
MSKGSTFQIKAPFSPKGDQPAAIEQLVQGARDGLAHQVLLGATGTGKTYTACQVIARLDRPALVIAHNKTLAAQLCQEIREFFPDNAVEYFVSYYDYYQPEAYVAHTDTFIEKESSRNEEIDRLRHSATHSLSSRRDVIVVVGVVHLGLGTPNLYQKTCWSCGRTSIDRAARWKKLVHMHFARNDINLVRGTFRVRGDVLEIHPRDSETHSASTLSATRSKHPDLIRDAEVSKTQVHHIFPATHFIAERPHGGALGNRTRLNEQVAYLKRASCSKRSASSSACATTWNDARRSVTATASKTTRAI